MKIVYGHVLFWLVIFTLPLSCTKTTDPQIYTTQYPVEVENILKTNCAVSGCHTTSSKQFADNLDLTDWQRLMEGAHNGAVAIPYAPNQSPLFQFINSYDHLGPMATPTMPLGDSVLSESDVTVIKNWIANGCMNKNGEIPFADNPASSKKIYIANQGCDLVSIIDGKSGMVMRYVSVGRDPNTIELPHNIQVSPDGKFWYVCFVNGTFVQQYDATTDKLLREVEIGEGSWNVIRISADQTRAYVSDLSSNGKLVTLSLPELSVLSVLTGAGVLSNPHGVAISSDRSTIYITAQNGNMIYRYKPAVPSLDAISLEKGKAPVTTPQLLDPHEVMYSPDEEYYFVTCQASNELRVMHAASDTLIKVIPVGKFPLEMAVSVRKNKLFVSCQEDPNPNNSNRKGSVYSIDIQQLVVDHIWYEDFFQPHGIGVDESRNILYVASRNVDPNGPAPHHIASCAGRNGYYSSIDLNTQTLIQEGFEISVDPYGLSVR
jgi:YVTN family beta-propeller protein